MFGFGNSRRRARSDTSGSHKIRNAAMAGIGMLAWKWWRNRQEAGRASTSPERSFSERSRRPADSF